MSSPTASETDFEDQWCLRLFTDFRARMSRRILCVFPGTRSEAGLLVSLRGGMRLWWNGSTPSLEIWRREEGGGRREEGGGRKEKEEGGRMNEEKRREKKVSRKALSPGWL